MAERDLNRFSQIYLFGGKASEDSPRFRVRLTALFWECAPYRSSAPSNVQAALERECGLKVDSLGYGSNMATVFEKAQLRDVLDAISITYRVVKAQYSPQNAARWKAEIPRLFAEENVAFRIDEQCVVHRLVDEEFYRATASAVQALETPQLAAAAVALRQALNFLTALHQNTKGAVTSTFEACEIVTKHLVPGVQNLHAKLCTTKLLELCMSPGAGEVERKVETGVFTAMAEWVNAVHNYRHGQAEAEPVAPSMELAVQLVSMGCSFIRRLARAYEANAQKAQGVAAAKPASSGRAAV